MPLPGLPNSYTVKNLRVTITLTESNAVFPGTNNNQLVMTGLRMSAVIKGSGVPAWPEASLRIWGMSQQDMNALAVVRVEGGKPQFTFNTVQIEADSGSGFVYVFSGQIFQAGPDYSAAPAVCLYLRAQSGGFQQLTPGTPTSYTGAANVADIAANIVSKMGFAFENDGVTGTLTNAYYSGTPSSQLRKLALDAGFYVAVEPANSTSNLVAISPPGVARNVAPFILSPASGLERYPEVQGNGYVACNSIYNPAFRMNAPITIQGSDVVIDYSLKTQTQLNSLADGNWVIGPLTHTLECQKPGGRWHTEMKLWPPNAAPSV